MKRLLSALLALLLLLTLAVGCGKEEALHQNLLKNGNFEEPLSTEENWHLDRYDTSDSPSNYGLVSFEDAPDGSHAARIDCKEANDARYVQTVPVESNSYYCFSGFIRADGLTERDAESGANLSVMDTYARTDFVKETDGWQKVSVYGRTGKEKEVTVALRVGFYSADCAGCAYFDGLRFEKIERDEIPSDAYVHELTPFSSGSQSSTGDGETTVNSVTAAVVLRALAWFILLFALAFLLLKYPRLSRPWVLWTALALGFVIRAVAAIRYHGFSVDVGCFASWAARMADKGAAKFYGGGTFCDYPPLYMLLLGLLGKLSGGASLSDGFGLLLLKMPAILADLGTAYLIYRIVRRKVGAGKGIMAGAVYALLPTAILNSAFWGQVDSVLVLLMLLTFDAFDRDKFGVGLLWYFAGLLTKPQAILFGPVVLLAAILEFAAIGQAAKKQKHKIVEKRLLFGFGALAIGLAVFATLSGVMRAGQEVTWLLEKYVDTVGSYDYATLSSFGFMGLLGGQWQPNDSSSPLGLSFGALGMAFRVLMLLALAALAYVLFRRAAQKKRSVELRQLWLLVSFTLAGLVTFSTMTHERYMFPVIALLLISAFSFRDARLLALSGGYAFVNFINTGIVLYRYETFKDIGNYYMNAKEPVMLIGSVLTVLLFAYQAFVTVKLVLSENNNVPGRLLAEPEKKKGPEAVKEESAPERKINWSQIIFIAVYILIGLLLFAVYTPSDPTPLAEFQRKTELTAYIAFFVIIETVSLLAYLVKRGKRNNEKRDEKNSSGTSLSRLLARRSFTLPRVTWKDVLICLLITVLYAGIAFSSLGDTEAPQTFWQAQPTEARVILDLGSTVPVDGLRVRTALGGGSGEYTVSYSQDGEEYYLSGTVEGYHKPGEWYDVSAGFSARYIRLSGEKGVSLNRVIPMNGDGPIAAVLTDPAVSPLDILEDTLTDASALNGGSDVPVTVLRENGTVTVSAGEGELSGTLSLYFLCDQLTEDEEAFYYGHDEEMDETGEFPMSTDRPVVIRYRADGAWHLYNTFASYNGWYEYDCGTDGLTDVMIELDYGAALAEIAGDALENAAVTFTGADGLVREATELTDEPETLANHVGSMNKAWAVTADGDCVIYDFGQPVTLATGSYYPSVGKGRFYVRYSADGSEWSEETTVNVEEGDLYKWKTFSGSGEPVRYALLTADAATVRLLEVGFYEGDSETVVPATVKAFSEGEHGGASVGDEQNLVQRKSSYMNSMYFDEIYHARTAFESLNGLSIYEWTHPPLGKDLMALSISVFGMTPFGWRFAGTMAGVLMLPIMYFLGLLMFRKRSWATLSELILALDGMHLAQTRLATIDSFGVLFILAMFLFMYWYYSLSFYNTKLSKTFIPLGLCGLSFGLGAASKWIGLYAGAGLAVIFFITVLRRAWEYRVAADNVDRTTGEEKEYLTSIVDSFGKNLLLTLLFCVLVFIVIPLILYCLSYIPYFRVTGETRPWYTIVWENQKSMYSYHSNLEATHPYQSDWYTWPIMYKPMWYLSGGNVGGNKISSISGFGNPAVWYVGLVCALGSIVLAVRKLLNVFSGTADDDALMLAKPAKGWLERLFAPGDEELKDKNERDGRLLLFLLLGAACNLVPWMGISRCVFIYHYFATLMFVMLLTVYFLRQLARQSRVSACVIVAVFLLLTLVLFFMFRPLWMGTPVDRDFVNRFLRWFPSWSFGS